MYISFSNNKSVSVKSHYPLIPTIHQILSQLTLKKNYNSDHLSEKFTKTVKEMNKTNGNKLIHRELPVSSYEVIQLLSGNDYKSPTNNSNKGSRGQQPVPKRQKVMTPLTSQVTRQPDEFRSTFSIKCPSFTQTLLKSQVTSSFGMGLPQSFCRKHLPLVNTELVLDFENGKQYKAKYLAERPAFSAGWKECCLAERLSDGDVLEFQLVNPTKFKVLRVKETGLSKVNGAHITPDLDARVEQNGTHGTTIEKTKEKQSASFFTELSGDEDDVVIQSQEDCDIVQKVDDAKKSTPGPNSGISKHLQLVPILGDYNDTATFDDFAEVLDELLKKDYKLPNHITWSYYQLCSTQKTILHANLLNGINPTFVAGCIIETVDISNALKTCDLSTFDSYFPTWDRKLKSLKYLGMDVKFLSDRLLHLQKIACSSEAAKKKQQYADLSSEQVDTENTIKSLQDKLAELIRVSEMRAGDIKKLKMDIEEHESRFWKEVSAPW